MGAEAFAKTGVPSSPGTAIFSVSGNVVRPGNYELPLGTPMRTLLYDYAGGIADGRELKAVIPGGSSVPALTPDQIDVPLDYDSLGAIGTFFGAASLIVVDDRCCMVQLALRSTKFYMHESCGKCTPCRVGTRWMVQILESIEAGTATMADLDLLENVGDNILGKVLCALGEFAVYPVDSYLKKWRAEFVAHVEQGGCPFHGESSLEGSSRRATCTTTRRWRRRRSYERRARHGQDRRARRPGREGDGHRRDRARRRASRSPSSVTSRASARRSAPAACASSRSRGCRSSRPAAP